MQLFQTQYLLLRIPFRVLIRAELAAGHGTLTADQLRVDLVMLFVRREHLLHLLDGSDPRLLRIFAGRGLDFRLVLPWQQVTNIVDDPHRRQSVDVLPWVLWILEGAFVSVAQRQSLITLICRCVTILFMERDEATVLDLFVPHRETVRPSWRRRDLVRGVETARGRPRRMLLCRLLGPHGFILG